ncbi:unnamed protein product [Brachionus calyciflorus]|uniref:Uncharacterized protein n=1 Tax=Brachionus calyciflorus TaxID=104777 RepID=A0A814GT44_9BILA|nr:unnamed protein product [Brachionus calyciflorus]
MNIDESIQSVIRSTIGDQSPREFKPSADKTSKAGVVWNKLNIGSSKKVRNKINFSRKTGYTRFASTKIDETALSVFRCLFDDSMINTKLMSKNKFAKVMKFLRFDEKSTRKTRRSNDKFCLI